MTTFAPDQLIGSTAVDAAGDKVGKIEQVYLDDQTGQPAWITVSTGLFGNRQSFAPLHGASMEGGGLALAVTKDQVKDAPNLDGDGHLNEDEQRELYDYYGGIVGGGSGEVYNRQPRTDQVGGPGADTSGPNTDSAMTRSEEQLRVGTENVETGRARLRKYVVTENVTQTVPVSHEEVRVEREPITEANVGAATDGPAISEEEHEVTLHAERPVVAKETVPVERVRMDTQTVSEQQQVEDTVRQERIEVDGDGNTR
jgi:uncharacterized protein (TIGR02271 family)